MTGGATPPPDWRPGADLETLRARAALLQAIRGFFSARGVLEVDTPLLAHSATVDRHIESFRVPQPKGDDLWLHTSPEFAMKRLLAAGSGPIYQLCHVFRAEEAGRWHNPEFMMLEWYRPGWDHHALMDEVEDLLQALGVSVGRRFERHSYADVFRRHAGFDPFQDHIDAMRAALQARAADQLTPAPAAEMDRDAWLDLCMATLVAPALGTAAPVFVQDFPASQAALARVRPGEPPVAERFELFWQGSELANGFHELLDAGEQQRRFEADLEWRRQQGRAVPPYDRRLIAALQHGLPSCAGVALGVDRLLMLLRDCRSVAQTMAFDVTRA